MYLAGIVTVLPIEWKIEEQYRKKGLNKDDVPSCYNLEKNVGNLLTTMDQIFKRKEFKRLGS